MKSLTPRYEKLIETLSSKLQQLESSESDQLIRTNTCLSVCVEHLDKLRRLATNHPFPNMAAEIHFFKKVKPAILSKIIYYRMVLDLQLDMRPGSSVTEEQYLTDTLKEATAFFEKNRPFYNYYVWGIQNLMKHCLYGEEKG